MIVCTLDGEKAYPLTSEKIKATYENPYVKDSGSYTYDITFPMAIAQNRKVFRNVQRMDVRKHIADFETCRLYVGNLISHTASDFRPTDKRLKKQKRLTISRLPSNKSGLGDSNARPLRP